MHSIFLEPMLTFVNDETGQLVDNALYRYPCDLGIYKRGTIKLLMLFSNKLSQEK